MLHLLKWYYYVSNHCILHLKKYVEKKEMFEISVFLRVAGYYPNKGFFALIQTWLAKTLGHVPHAFQYFSV